MSLFRKTTRRTRRLGHPQVRADREVEVVRDGLDPHAGLTDEARVDDRGERAPGPVLDDDHLDVVVAAVLEHGADGTHGHPPVLEGRHRDRHATRNPCRGSAPDRLPVHHPTAQVLPARVVGVDLVRVAVRGLGLAPPRAPTSARRSGGRRTAGARGPRPRRGRQDAVHGAPGARCPARRARGSGRARRRDASPPRARRPGSAPSRTAAPRRDDQAPIAGSPAGRARSRGSSCRRTSATRTAGWGRRTPRPHAPGSP